MAKGAAVKHFAAQHRQAVTWAELERLEARFLRERLRLCKAERDLLKAELAEARLSRWVRLKRWLRHG